MYNNMTENQRKGTKENTTWLPTLPTPINDTLNSVLHTLLHDPSFNFALGIGATTELNNGGPAEIKIADQELEYSWHRNLKQHSEEIETEQAVFNNSLTEQKKMASSEAHHWNFGEGDNKHSKREETTKNNATETAKFAEKANNRNNANEKSNKCNYYADDEHAKIVKHHNDINKRTFYQEQEVDENDRENDYDEEEYYEGDMCWDDEDVDEEEGEDEENDANIRDVESIISSTTTVDEKSLGLNEEDYDGDDEYSINFDCDEDDEVYANGYDDEFSSFNDENEKKENHEVDNDEDDDDEEKNGTDDSEVHSHDKANGRRRHTSTVNNKRSKHLEEEDDEEVTDDESYVDEDDDAEDADDEDDGNVANEEYEAEIASQNNRNASDMKRSAYYNIIAAGRHHINDFFNESDFEYDDNERAVSKVVQVYDNIEYRNGMTIEEMAKLMEEASLSAVQRTNAKRLN